MEWFGADLARHGSARLGVACFGMVGNGMAWLDAGIPEIKGLLK